ncbi:MAG: bifunctional 4-hydroxy-2-oxoglutarate aldolase/2-dehydro-3-deoxy-phosphogluconate aldolase [Chloroflexota bacterium]
MITNLQDVGVIAQLPHTLPSEHLWMIADALLASPILAVAVALNSENPKPSYELIQDMRQRGRQNMLVGVSHVTTAKQARQAIRSGAQFIISERWQRELLPICRRQKLPYIPQVISALGAQMLHDEGCEWLQIRTGGADGPAYVLTLATQSLPNLRLLVASDVNANLVREYQQAGATAVLTTNLIHSPDQKMADIITEARALREAWIGD